MSERAFLIFVYSVKIRVRRPRWLKLMGWEIIICREVVELSSISQMAEETFGDYVKGVVDVEKKILGLGGELHSDIEEVLLSQGSFQQNLWGINVYPGAGWPEMVEFDSLINIRPRQNNRSRYVEDEVLRYDILKLVDELVQR